MTREEKELLLKDLSARASYGVKAEVPNHINPLQILGIKKLYKGTWAGRKGTWLVSFWNDVRPIENIKPYLRPMYSMTEEEKKEFQACHCVYEWHPDFQPTMCNLANECNMFDWLITHHFDFRGLISKGLALEAPDGMYEKGGNK